MNEKLSVIMQGNVNQWTQELIWDFNKYMFVGEVIVSTWKGQPESKDCRNIFSNPPENPSVGNRNMQIVSSLNGAKSANCEWAMKVRGDFFLPELQKMWDFAKNNWTPKIKAFVLSVHRHHAFHPRDYVFLGKRQDIIDIFDIPLCQHPSCNIDSNELYSHVIRSECYIAKFCYKDICKEIIDNEQEYLLDRSPLKQKAMEIYSECVRNNLVIVPFPKVNFHWPAKYPNGYPFGCYEHEDIYNENAKNFIC